MNKLFCLFGQVSDLPPLREARLWRHGSEWVMAAGGSCRPCQSMIRTSPLVAVDEMATSAAPLSCWIRPDWKYPNGPTCSLGDSLSGVRPHQAYARVQEIPANGV